jgi:glycine cleavage system H protein
MNPKDLKYTKDHEWIRAKGAQGEMGLADYAQTQLGDIVYLDLPAPGTQVTQFKKLGEVESVKAVSDIFAPASGKVIEVNKTVVDEPKLVNDDCYGKGWLLKIEIANPGELNNLMGIDVYDKLVAKLTAEGGGH